jgi:flagellar biosynthesis/type III secretory pathway chaperone
MYFYSILLLQELDVEMKMLHDKGGEENSYLENRVSFLAKECERLREDRLINNSIVSNSILIH